MDTNSRKIVIYADGAASPNPGYGGYGVVLTREGQRREFSGGFRKTTNNRMEILGVLVGLRAVLEPDARITVYSDSRYVVDMVNGGYVAQWRRHGWRRNRGKDAVLNRDLWDELLNLCAGRTVNFIWVRGHAANQENARCDELAVQARQAGNLPPDTGYESPGVSRPDAPLVPPASPIQLTLFDSLGNDCLSANATNCPANRRHAQRIRTQERRQADEPPA